MPKASRERTSVKRGEATLDRMGYNVRVALRQIPPPAEVNRSNFHQSVNFLRYLLRLKRNVIEFFEPIKSAAYQAWKNTCSREKEFLDAIEKREAEYRAGIAKYLEESEKISELAPEIISGETAEAVEKLAASGPGTPEELEAVMQAAARAVAGASEWDGWSYLLVRNRYVAEVVDRNALIRAVADKELPEGLVQVNMSVLNSLVNAHKGKIQIPGVQVRREKVLAVKSYPGENHHE